jgi:transposase
MQIHSVGIDLGKTTFHLVALGDHGKVLLKKKFTQRQLITFTANLQTSLVGMEACSGAHFLGRALRAQGHEVKLIPAQFVKPFVKSNKNDFIDAEAIAEAVTRENMRFVPIKTDDQLDLQALHRVRERLMARRTSVINQIRAFLLERGIVFAKSPIRSREAIPDVLENANENLTPRMRNLVAMLWSEWKDLELQIVEMNDEVERIASSDDACRRLRQIPGIGSLVATAIVASIGNGAPSIRDESSQPGWDCCRSSTRPAARRGCLGSASVATVTCARSSSMGLEPSCCDRSETGSRWEHGLRRSR